MKILISGPSAVGKTTVTNAMMHRNAHLKPLPGYTTRAPRPGEVDGVDAHFITKDSFTCKEADREFCESEEYCGDRHATAKADMEDDGDFIGVRTPPGAVDIKKAYPDVRLFYLMPMNYLELIRRLKERGMDEDTIVKRLMKDIDYMHLLPSYDLIVVNASVIDTVRQIEWAAGLGSH